MLTAAAYDIHLEQLLERMWRFHAVLDAAGIPYRIVGGMAAYIHVLEQEPDNARLTRDVDAAVTRADLARIIEAAEKSGFRYRHVKGVDMLVDAEQPRGAIRGPSPVYWRKGPGGRPGARARKCAGSDERRHSGCIAVADLVQMKLTSFRLKDQVHIQDLDGVGLITPEIEAGLSGALRERLAQVRASR